MTRNNIEVKKQRHDGIAEDIGGDLGKNLHESSNDSEDDDEDDFLYGVENEDVADQSTANDSNSVSLSGNVDRKIATIKSYQFFPCDVLVNIGPITSMLIDEKTKRENIEAYDALRNRGEEIICSSGYRTNSGLVTLHSGMELFDRMTFVLKGGKCKGSWALRIVMSDTESSDDDEDIYHNLLVLSVGKQTKLFPFKMEVCNPCRKT